MQFTGWSLRTFVAFATVSGHLLVVGVLQGVGVLLMYWYTIGERGIASPSSEA